MSPPAVETLWNPQDLAATEAALRNLLIHSPGDTAYLVELNSWIARAQALQNQLSQAKVTLEAAELLLKTVSPAQLPNTRMRWLIERGRLYILERTPSQARLALAEAWPIATANGEDFFQVEIAQLMAEIEPHKQQQEWIERAITISEKSKSPRARAQLGDLYSSLGWKLYELHQFEKALQIFHKSLTHLQSLGMNSEAFQIQGSIARVLRAQGKTEEALNLNRTLLAEMEKIGQKDGRLFEELAECLQSLRRTNEAQVYFALAYQELSSQEWVKDNQPVKLKRLKDLGKVK